MKSIWNTSLNILARRDHSRAELLAKLTSRFPDQHDEIESVLDRLVDCGLQSDTEFAQMWLRAQISKRRGPRRIQAESRAKGISNLIDRMISDPEVDWFALALECGERKFNKIETIQEKAKAYRFLAYRGFESDSIQYALGKLSSVD